jgi:hypothetical protein
MYKGDETITAIKRILDELERPNAIACVVELHAAGGITKSEYDQLMDGLLSRTEEQVIE